MRKLRGVSKPAMLCIEHAESRFLNRRNNARRNPPAATGKRFILRDRGLDHLCLLHHVAVFFFVSVGNAQQDALEAGTPIAIVRRKISSTIKRLAIGSKKRRKR